MCFCCKLVFETFSMYLEGQSLLNGPRVTAMRQRPLTRLHQIHSHIVGAVKTK